MVHFQAPPTFSPGEMGTQERHVPPAPLPPGEWLWAGVEGWAQTQSSFLCLQSWHRGFILCAVGVKAIFNSLFPDMFQNKGVGGGWDSSAQGQCGMGSWSGVLGGCSPRVHLFEEGEAREQAGR